MLRLYPSEVFKEVPIEHPLRRRYAVSNFGRLISFSEFFQDGRILKGSNLSGYQLLVYKVNGNDQKKSKHFFIGRLVAELFIPKSSDDQCYVLHLDYQRDNDNVSNLKWATRAEMVAHGHKSPKVIAMRGKSRLGKGKLTSTQVIHLKKRLLDPNRKTRIKLLAKQFGVSEMQIMRIKRGENWGHIKI